MKEIKKGQFVYKILVICQTAFLCTLRVLDTELNLGMSWGSHYIQNMLALLLCCITVKQHAIIRLLWSEGVKLPESHRSMVVQYGENCIMQKVYQWMARFQSGRKIIDEDCLGHLPTSQTAESVGMSSCSGSRRQMNYCH
jgi:hypothetical protein